MASNYTELVESIADELARSDLYDVIPGWIKLAEVHICREANVPEGQYIFVGNLIPDQEYVELPYGIKRPIHVEIQSNPLRILEQVDWTKRSDVLQNDDGRLPRAYTILNTRLYLAPVPRGDEEYKFVYYGMPPPLSESNQTNTLLEQGPDALRYQALSYSAPFLGEDERVATWDALASRAIRSLKNEFWDRALGAGVMRIRPDFSSRDSHR